MDKVSSRTFWTVILLLAIVSCLLAAITVRSGTGFSAAVGSYPFHNILLGLYEAQDARDLHTLLWSSSDDARRLFLSMFSGADTLLPACLTVLGMVLMARFAPGGRIYGVAVTPAVLRGLLALPLAYGLFDYAENGLSLMYFRSEPLALSAWMSVNAPVILPWLGKFKMVLALVTAILILRFFLVGRANRRDDGAAQG